MGFWSKKTPQERAESFDAQHADSERRANKKRTEGKYPYDVDKKIKDAGKVERRKKKGK